LRNASDVTAEPVPFLRPGSLCRDEPMATPNWPLFGAAVVVITLALLVLSRTSARAIATSASEQPAGGVGPPDGSDGEPLSLPTGAALQANVALTHGLLAIVTIGAVWIAAVPPSAIGLAAPAGSNLAVGLGLGIGLYLASESATALADRLGVRFDERLRELLSPDGWAEWAVLVLVVLPIIAIAEELLFRGVLVGAIAAGFGLPAWVLVVGSAVLFGLGHTAQGDIGVAVTGALGLVLGAAFVLTGSLATVVIAHYLVDVLEFVVHEGLLGSAGTADR